jgi:elongation factor G
MEKDDSQPRTQPSGNRPPPRPPNRIAVGFGPEGGDSNRKSLATITRSANGEGRFIRQSSGSGRSQHGHVILKVEPNGRGKGIEIRNDRRDGAIPPQFIKDVARGVRIALEGMVIGHPAVDEHPVVDIVVRIIGGSFHETDSSEIAFVLAGIFAIKDAVKKAEPIAIA